MASNEINIDSFAVRKSNLLSSRIDNEIVILNIEKGEYNGLDEIGSNIWNHLDAPIRLANLVAKLIEKYDIDKQQCTLDVIDFIIELEKAGLVEIKNETER